jgi:hypothetical protein
VNLSAYLRKNRYCRPNGCHGLSWEDIQPGSTYTGLSLPSKVRGKLLENAFKYNPSGGMSPVTLVRGRERTPG